jgi:hypothetical protein
MSNLMTFHRILPGCEEGKREAWHAFLAEYSRIAFRLFEVYSPWTDDQRLEFWLQALRALTAEQCAPLRHFSHQSKREFLVDLRAFLMDWMVTKLELSQQAEEPPAPTADTLVAMLKGLPLVHQEIAFFALAGYSQGTIESIMGISPSVAGEGIGRLRTHCGPVLDRTEDRCLWPAAWVGITRAARANGQKDCAPLRLLIHILDGQAKWENKLPVEQRRTTCLHCLELWTSLLEVVSWDRHGKPWPAEKVAPLLAAVPLKSQEKAQTSLLARMFER